MLHKGNINTDEQIIAATIRKQVNARIEYKGSFTYSDEDKEIISFAL